MKNFYIAIQVKEDDKFFAYVMNVFEYENLASRLNIDNMIAANICSTRKRAESLVRCWNDTWRANNEYMFADAPF